MATKSKTKSNSYNNKGELSIEQRVNKMISKMTLEEKVSQMVHDSKEIKRLGIPGYTWWNEALHGVARLGRATVFPQAIAMAATFDDKLLEKVAEAISDEARAKYHDALRIGSIYVGLTYWSPNINIFRDPRWGRGQETYGEDPYLTSRMGVAFVKGLQGRDKKYLKVVATPKHFAVHSGPEAERHRFNAVVSKRDLRETYLRAFKACVTEGKAASIMSAYNRTNCEPCSASKTLLLDILRDEWKFEGFVVSDCGAIEDIYLNHKIVATEEEAAALAVKNGCDLCCGSAYNALVKAVHKGLISEQEIDCALRRLLQAKFRLGMFDPPSQVPFSKIPPSIVHSPKHRTLARRMAQESIVLLKNEGNILPLSKDTARIAVVGPNATSYRVLLGNYYGYSPTQTTILEGIVGAAAAGCRVWYAQGCDLRGNDQRGFKEAVWMASVSDVTVAVLGWSPELEGEEGEVAASDGGGDRNSLLMPGVQQQLLEELVKTGKPVVLVVTGGSPIDLNWAAEHVPAILMCWYGGEEGGNAVADVLFGDYNPAGRLPVTFPRSLDQLPPFTDYAMAGRTYRFMKEQPLYRFGYGLSYTKFTYSNLKLDKKVINRNDEVKVSVTVTNSGKVAGDEVVQLYVSDVEASVPVPLLHLEGFKRIHLKPKQKETVTFILKPHQLAAYDDEGRPFVEPGQFIISVGGGQPHDKCSNAVTATLTVR